MTPLGNDSTRQSNLVRINQALYFIEQNLDKDLSLNVLARITCYSPFHFHRIFTAICGETPHEFVIRKRIEKIGWIMLKQKHIPIKEFAYQYGFQNASSFSRAFKKYYGMSATEFRKQSTSVFNKVVRKHNSKIGKESVSVEKYFYNTEKVKEWMSGRTEVRTQFLDQQHLVYIRSQGSFDLADLAFERLRDWARAKGLLSQNDKRKWSLVIHDNPAITEVSKMSHSACLKVDEDLDFGEEMGVMRIPAGLFLVGTFEIPDEEFEMAWGGVGLCLVERGYRLRDGHLFEIFHTDSVFQKGARHPVDICMPIH